MKKMLSWLCSLMCLIACDPIGLEEPLTESEISQILEFNYELDNSGLETVILLTAKIKAGVDDPKKRIIIFKSDRGTFLSSEENKKTVTVTANLAGVAQASLKTDFQGGLFILSAELGIAPEINKSKNITITAPNEADIFSLNLTEDTIYKADGTSLIRLEAIIDPAFRPSEEKNVTFRHNIKGGQFQDSITPQEFKIKSVNGEVTAVIQLGTTPGNYTISGELSPTAIKTSLPLSVKALQPDEVIQVLSLDTVAVEADGISSALVSLKISNSPVRWIQLEKDLGELLVEKPDLVALNPNGEVAFVYQMSTEVKPHRVIVTVAHDPPIFSSILVTPKRALPDDLFLTADKYEVDIDAISTETIQLNAKLRRASGTPSINTSVQFLAYQLLNDGDTSRVGTFDNMYDALSMTNGDLPGITFRFLGNQPIDTTQAVVIEAFVAERNAIRKTVSIDLK